MSRRSARTKISFLSRRFQPQANQNVNEDRIPDTLSLDTLAPLSSDVGRYDDLVVRAGEIITQRIKIYGPQSAKMAIDMNDYPQCSAMKTMLSRLNKRATKDSSQKKVASSKMQKKTAAKLEKLLERATSEQHEAGQESDEDADDIKVSTAKKRRRIESESDSDGDAKAADTDDDAEDGQGKKDADGDDVKPTNAAKKQRDADEELSDDVGSLASSEMSETAGDYGLNYVDEDYSELEDADNDYAGDY